MKKIFLPLFFVGLVAAMFSLQSNATRTIETAHFKPNNSGGAAAGKTGAPGEQNCTACHSGTAQNGANENLLTLSDGTTTVTSYTPGQQYTVSLSMSSNPVKKGFQATALTSANVMAGNFAVGTGNTSINGTTKKYANHTSASNTAANWTWTWTAPAVGTGNVTFYVATNKTNNSGTDMGDVIYLSQHVFSEATGSAGINEFNSEVFQVYFDAESNTIITRFDNIAQEKTTIKLIDMTGKEVFFGALGLSEIGKNNISVDVNKSLNKGVYVATLIIGKKVYSKKIMIQ